jgi:hypothetical protein
MRLQRPRLHERKQIIAVLLFLNCASVRHFGFHKVPRFASPIFMSFKIHSGRTNKFRARKTVLDGLTFASKAEAQRYADLKILLRIGEISGLELQPSFDLVVNGQLVCRYVADFRYRDTATGQVIVEDVKSAPTRTPEYRIKRKLMAACHGITVLETGKISPRKSAGRN